MDCLVDVMHVSCPMGARHRTPRIVVSPNKITRIVDALCALWATLTSDLIGRAIKPRGGVCRRPFQRDARCHWRRHGICSMCSAPRGYGIDPPRINGPAVPPELGAPGHQHRRQRLREFAADLVPQKVQF